MNFSDFYEGVAILEEEGKLHKQLNEDAKQAKDYQVDPKILKRVKDYVYYYKRDWLNGDPFTPDPDEEWKCRLIKGFRKIRQAIIDLREVDRLDLLEPIINALEEDGIYLRIDEEENKHREELKQIVSGMCSIQKNICQLADERKEIAQSVEDSAICTKSCYNFTVGQMKKAKKNEEKQGQAVSKVGEKYVENNRDNMIFDAFIRENCQSEDISQEE